jgi:hypothetical protein
MFNPYLGEGHKTKEVVIFGCPDNPCLDLLERSGGIWVGFLTNKKKELYYQ